MECLSWNLQRKITAIYRERIVPRTYHRHSWSTSKETSRRFLTPPPSQYTWEWILTDCPTCRDLPTAGYVLPPWLLPSVFQGQGHRLQRYWGRLRCHYGAVVLCPPAKVKSRKMHWGHEQQRPQDRSNITLLYYKLRDAHNKESDFLKLHPCIKRMAASIYEALTVIFVRSDGRRRVDPAS